MNRTIPMLLLFLVSLAAPGCNKKENSPTQTSTNNSSTPLPLSGMNWICYVPLPSGHYVNLISGVFESNSDGLKIYGTGYRAGAELEPLPLSDYPISGKTLYFKWKANGGGNFMGVGPRIFTDSVSWTMPYYPVNLTTDHSYLNSYVITNDLWYYTRILIGSTTYTATTATGNYDDAGGTVVQTKTDTLDHDYRCLGFGLWDCYASTAAYAVLGDVKIK